jgi:hypothetical protein
MVVAGLGLLAAVGSAASVSAQRATKSGRWEAELALRYRDGGPRQLWVDFENRRDRWRDRSDFGFRIKAADLAGLTASDPRWSGAARFELRREAGVITFEGRFEDGAGEGTYRFDADPRFLREVEQAGATDAGGDELLAMLIHDVRIDWLAGLRQAGIRPVDAGDVLAMRIHGVEPEFVRDLSTMGFERLTSERLVALRIHGVSPDFIREIRATVPAPDLDQLVAFRIHKVTPAFAREVAALGYRDTDPDQLVAMRIHGVSPVFIRAMTDLGLRDLELDDLVSFRVHGIDAEFVREATRAGVRLDADELVSYRIHGGRWRHRSRDR